MNIPRYLCNENIKNDFIQFLIESNKNKSNVHCNLEKYKQLIELFPLHNKIKQDFDSYTKNANICIDITQSDDETEQICAPDQNKDNDNILDDVNTVVSDSFQNLEGPNINDIADSIKDSLSIQNVANIIKDLANLGNDNLDKLFLSLANQLSLEDVENFWNSLMDSNINNEYVILCYVKFLLLPRVKQEFSYKLEAVFMTASQKYPTVIKNELVREFLTIEPMTAERNRVLQQYVGTFKNDFKTDMLRQFIYTCQKLHPNCISIIDVLLNPKSDYDILSKIIEVMSKSVTEFTNDNAYGKLLFNVINLLERNVCQLEQPLKHILGIHRSIWKMKVQKVVFSWCDDSLTQSFI